MLVFISYSQRDRSAAERIATRIKADGHDVWLDSQRVRPGDNVRTKIDEGLQNADAIVALISENAFRSEWVQFEFTQIALQQIYTQRQIVIPVKLDDSAVPSYLADRLYIDMSQDFDAGLDALSKTIVASSRNRTTSDHPSITRSSDRRENHVNRLRDALRAGRLTLVCGAGISVGAGIPAWGDLLIKLLESMMQRLSKEHSIDLGSKAATQFQELYVGSSLILGKYLKNNLGRDFAKEVRTALYASKPKRSELIDAIMDLSRPQRDGEPLDSIITFNFDGLIEESLDEQSIPNRPIFTEEIKHDRNQLPIYHVHGFLPRDRKIAAETELVFSEDAYHSQFIDPFSWSNLILLNKLTQNTCLFAGISLTDPNMRRLLDVAWRKNPDKILGHYVVKRVPKTGKADKLDQISKLLEEQDANALGLNVIWIDEFDELPRLIRDIAARR